MVAISESCITLELTVLSAEDLRIDGKPIKRNAFVIVQTDPYTTKSTHADFEGGSYPSWNQKLQLAMSMHVRSITLEVQCKPSTASSNRVVGAVNVPVSDFLGGFTPDDYLHFLSYRLRSVRGVKNGVINFSIRVIEGFNYIGKKNVGAMPRIDYWTISNNHTNNVASSSGDRKNSNGACSVDGVVTGIPVKWGA